ncbi:MAG: alpha/beta hydrolase [Deltaproteobacteria bacterium]|nr:alpha/beta hydrolase [Deltaproteobacteria bacterium]
MKRALARAGIAERRFDTGEVELNFADGPAGGTPLVLIPGQTMPWESYTKVLPALAGRFHVFAVDVRGHGKSGWTPGAYTLGAMGRDIAALLRGVVKQPAIVTGNSSGGVIAVAAAAECPELVRAIVPEDPPLFSCEYPRIRECYVWHILQSTVTHLSGPGPRDIPGFFADFEVPADGSQKIMRFPRPAVQVVRAVLRMNRFISRDGPVDLPFLPLAVRLFIRGLSEYDPEFSRAFLTEAAHSDFSHETVLRAVRCPILLLRADWFVHPSLGLVGAMTDEDVARVRDCVPHLEYRRIHGAHVLHIDRPAQFVEAVTAFADRLDQRRRRPRGRSLQWRKSAGGLARGQDPTEKSQPVVAARFLSPR